jgi:benzoate-CoA ligase
VELKLPRGADPVVTPLERAATRFDEKIYDEEWRAFRDPQIPDWINPIDVLLRRQIREGFNSKTAIVVEGESVSYGALNELIKKYAGGLAAIGLAPEQRMLLFGTDSLDYVGAWLGSIYLGAVPAVVSDLYKQKDLLYFLIDTAARVLYIDSEQVSKLVEIADGVPATLKTILVRGEITAELTRHFPKQSIVALAAVVAGAAALNEPYLRHANDVTYMFYSGGTTGTAKGITHLAHDFVVVPERQGRFWEYSRNDVVFATSKKYFTHGIWPGLLIPLYWGATAVLERRPPTPDVVLAVLREHAITKLITVPTVLKNMIEHVNQTKASSNFPALRFVASASEKMPPEMFERFHNMFGVELFDSIGSSEITYEWIANRPKAFRRGSLGKPIFGYEVRLVGSDGRDVTEPNVAGEAWIRSPTVCFYYWRKYDKSRETFVGEWARTGDHLMFDEDGFFWFSGRANDLFKVKGLWVSPLEIEAALTRHPAVREAAVVPFTDGDGLTKPKAYLVLREGFPMNDALLTELRAAIVPLGSYLVPESFCAIDQLPRTTLLKINRRALRDQTR